MSINFNEVMQIASDRLNQSIHGNLALGPSPSNVDISKGNPTPPTGKYPFVGHHYYGEFPSYEYDPYSDTYYPKFKDWRNYQYSHGLMQKGPGYAEQLAKAVAPGLIQNAITSGGGKEGGLLSGVAGIPGRVTGDIKNAYHDSWLESAMNGLFGSSNSNLAEGSPANFAESMGAVNPIFMDISDTANANQAALEATSTFPGNEWLAGWY